MSTRKSIDISVRKSEFPGIVVVADFMGLLLLEEDGAN
jgi:hypothetical protein